MLHAHDAVHSIGMRLEYSTQLFKTATIEKFAKFYMEILEQVTADPLVKLSDIRTSLHLQVSNANILQEDKDDWDQVFV